MIAQAETTINKFAAQEEQTLQGKNSNAHRTSFVERLETKRGGNNDCEIPLPHLSEVQ